MRAKRKSWKTKMIDPPDLSTWSFTADTRPVWVMLVLGSLAESVSSESVVAEKRARSALNGPDEKIVWRRSMTMEVETA